ncbi:MAG: MFS transporter [Anaerolineae bacterium]|nr:MFS transporter [Anaerolineae bacterium]
MPRSTLDPKLAHRSLTVQPARFTSGFRALYNRNYRLFWTAQLVSLSGSWMQTTAQAWLVLKLTGSPLSLGTVMTLQFLPITLLTLYGGVLADRLPKRAALVFTQGAAMIQAFIFGGLVAADVIQLWHIYILAAIQGLINAIDNPTRQAFVVELVGREDVLNAVALNSTAFNTARIIGPSLAGVIIDQIDIAPTLILNAVSFIPVLIALLRMDASQFHRITAAPHGTAMQRLKEGLSYAWHTPAILSILLVVLFIGTFGYNFSLVLPLLAEFVLHTSAAGFGSLGSFLGVGSLIGAITMAYSGQAAMRRLLTGAGAFSILLGTLALSRVFMLSGGLLILLGFAGITFATSSNTLLQLTAPDALRGRIMSVYILMFVGSTPLGSLVIGALSDHIGVQATLLICSVLCLIGVGIATLYWRKPHPATDSNRQ